MRHHLVSTAVAVAAALAVAAPASASSDDGCLELADTHQRGKLTVAFKGQACPSGDGLDISGSAKATFKGKKVKRITLEDAIAVAGKDISFAAGPPGFRGSEHRAERRIAKRAKKKISTRFGGRDSVTFDGVATKVTRQVIAKVKVGKRTFTVRAVASGAIEVPSEDVTCDDGSTAPTAEECPAEKPRTEVTCDDGSKVETVEECPKPKVPCTDGSEADTADDCPTPPAPCSDGSSAQTPEQCPKPPVTCEDGSKAEAEEDCPKPPAPCADGSTAPTAEQCPSPPVRCWDNSMAPTAEQCPNQPVRCWDGSMAPSEQQCPAQVECWNGSVVTSPSACPARPRCANGQEVTDLSECGSAPVAFNATKEFNAGTMTHGARVYAEDADSDIVTYKLVSKSFGDTYAAFTFNTGTGQFTIRRGSASATWVTFTWQAIDSKGNVSKTATYTLRFQ